MQRTQVNELNELQAGTRVLLQGWLHELRDQSKVKFLLLRDRTGIVQTVITAASDAFAMMSEVPRESVLAIEGTVKTAEVRSAEVTVKNLEVVVEKCTLLSRAESGLPLEVAGVKEEAALPVRLNYRWLDLRRPQNTLIFRVWTVMEHAMREFCLQRGFIQVHSPKIMGTPSESGAELFTIDYFGRKAFLAQSPQFYKQMAIASGFERVFEVGPVFRADPSHTTRHNTEFTGFDAEISFVESHEDVMRFEEEMLAYAIARVKEAFGTEIERAFGTPVVVPAVPFPRVTFAQAHELLAERGGSAEGDLTPDDEKLLCEIIKERYGHEFVFVTEYPVSIRPFYHMRMEGNPKLTKSFDLLWKGVEITTGAQREHRYEVLKQQAIEKGLNLEPIEDYLNFFRYGCPPHGGIGIGPARVVMLLLGLKNIRESTFLPRDTDRLRP
jgi:aspartyl-tRNA synthetase